MRLFLAFLVIAVGIIAYLSFFSEPSGGEESPRPDEQEQSVQTPSTPQELLAIGRYADAKVKLSEVPGTHRNQEWHWSMAAALRGTGQREESLKEVQLYEATASVTEKLRAQVFRAEVLTEMGKNEEAQEILHGIVKKHPGTPEALNAARNLKTQWSRWLEEQSNEERYPELARVITYIIKNTVDPSIQEDCIQLMKRVNSKLFFSARAYPGIVSFYDVQYGDFLSTIAKKYKVYPDRLMRVNNIKDRNSIRQGQTLRIIQGRTRMIVFLERFEMWVFIDDIFFRRYQVGIGKENKTPPMITTVSNSLARNPSYRSPEGKMVPPDHPDNPIGTRWIGFEYGQGYGIHGTREPETIGKPSSNGCIRLRNEEVEELFDYVMVGDEVVIK